MNEDQEVLRGLLHDLNSASGPLRDATGFLSEKLGRIKLLLEDPSGGQLALLEKLETLALGIDGNKQKSGNRSKPKSRVSMLFGTLQRALTQSLPD